MNGPRQPPIVIEGPIAEHLEILGGVTFLRGVPFTILGSGSPTASKIVSATSTTW
jgi:hypothetical protein